MWTKDKTRSVDEVIRKAAEARDKDDLAEALIQVEEETGYDIGFIYDIFTEALIDEDLTREEAEEMAEMEIKANGIKHYEKSDQPRKTAKKERKVDATKKRLLMDCKVLLEGLGAEILGVKTETEVTFTFEGEEYSLKLIKHRPKKE